MSNYSFSDAAIRDLDEICEYIARSSPKAASKLFDDIRSKCKLNLVYLENCSFVGWVQQ
ncbi:MAG: type II toxin-antitoxin system RelE/ParE family toxin [Nostoc sp. DedSLP03]|uniref:type II toxin-antitoxin system RelE/ParE family toxin n=1 Tax=Nostoc sp. DedSLP03 TaxID=3075400 RepID=UPI002AD571FB|nr:type II toxin-antitoxin system RelE/ParE family toxin [Nostoc sp. DedSLP03]MDZ7965540.1 type II toxin-antitoxin system RelE/ParE family toxin [Nostoc sp. DedSLP03]